MPSNNENNFLDAYNHGDRKSNKIALTFDDGPNPFWTEKILDILDKYSVKANFFVLGKWAEQYPKIVKKQFDKGHIIGNHSYSHPKTGCADFEKAETIISKIIGANTKFIRAPYFGAVLESCYDRAKKGEVKIINADLQPHDWKSKSELILEAIEKNARNGSIILLHDGSHNDLELEKRPIEMFKALPLIIEKLSEKFKIARLDEMDFVND